MPVPHEPLAAVHPMHWFQSLSRSNRRLKPQISHGFLAPFEGFPDASPGVLQVWENVGIQVIMGLRGSVVNWVRRRFAIFGRYEWASVAELRGSSRARPTARRLRELS